MADIYIIYNIYEKSTVQLASVGLAQACPNYCAANSETRLSFPLSLCARLGRGVCMCRVSRWAWTDTVVFTFGLRLISWLCKMCPYWLTVDTTCHASKRSVYFNCRMICVITALHLGLELLGESFSLRVGANLNLMTFSRYWKWLFKFGEE